jgi:flagellar hook-associated protein 3 FlgL
MLRISTYMQYQAGEQAISARQRELLEAQMRVSSGKRISVPSDDPLGAATGAALRTGLSQLDQFRGNQSHAQYLLNQSESAVAQFTDALQEAKDKLLAAANGTVGDEQRLMYARDIEGILARMVGLANSADGVGGYLFAGAREAAAPFGQSGNAVTFSGDENVQHIEVSNNRYIQAKLTGDDVFLKLRPGNGTFTTAAAATNTGAGRIDAGGVIDPSQITGSDYTIDFNGAQFVVTRASDNVQFTFAQASTGATSLQFDGMRVSISGTPAGGDRFTITPAGYQSVFDTMALAIAALKTPAPDAAARARIDTMLGGAGASVDQAVDHLLLKRAEIGSSLAELDGYQKLNEDRGLEYQGRLSDIEDVDYARAITELTRRQSTFEAAIKSYSSMSKLSLFDYL